MLARRLCFHKVLRPAISTQDFLAVLRLQGNVETLYKFRITVPCFSRIIVKRLNTYTTAYLQFQLIRPRQSKIQQYAVNIFPLSSKHAGLQRFLNLNFVKLTVHLPVIFRSQSTSTLENRAIRIKHENQSINRVTDCLFACTLLPHLYSSLLFYFFLLSSFSFPVLLPPLLLSLIYLILFLHCASFYLPAPFCALFVFISFLFLLVSPFLSTSFSNYFRLSFCFYFVISPSHCRLHFTSFSLNFLIRKKPPFCPEMQPTAYGTVLRMPVASTHPQPSRGTSVWPWPRDI